MTKETAKGFIWVISLAILGLLAVILAQGNRITQLEKEIDYTLELKGDTVIVKPKDGAPHVIHLEDVEEFIVKDSL